jgi:hypothetical protein
MTQFGGAESFHEVTADSMSVCEPTDGTASH